DNDLVPTQEIAKYYERRADAGLIITEGTIVRPDGQGYPNTPGIFNQSQIDGWKIVTEKVHQKGGKIFCQLWHVGRVSHPKYLNGNLPVAPSPIGLKGRVPRSGKKDALEYGEPRELKKSEMPQYIDSFVKAGVNAITAGFDGVEIHGAHGYLIDEFLHYDTNRRSDDYGGSPENMSRFLLEILKGMITEIGSHKVGVRLSPSAYSSLNADQRDDDIFKYLLSVMSDMDLAYVHQGIIDESKKLKYIGNSGGEYLRANFQGALIGNGDYNLESAKNDIRNGKFDLISIGKYFISNPDLIEKIKKGEPWFPYNNSLLEKLY
ncbi:MAG: alkene reductase, partial [Melioribacteraceae bacterium]|nr:alkene reductase [Melioribacteraceae bacterium]